VSATYLVVGGTSGIGAAVLERLVAGGNVVIQLSRHPERAPAGPLVTSIAWDAGGEPFPVAQLPEVLDGLVYCPGSIRLKPFARLTERDFEEDLALNLMGAVRALQGSLPSLQRAAGGASVVLFSTVAVGTGMPFHASVASAKGAIEGLTRSLAAELAPRVRVNAVAPTVTDTPLAGRLLGSEEKRRAAAARHPLEAVGDASDVAKAVLWLLCDAPMVTGQVIPCDGGLSSLRLLR
jgi:NAD(P)-dependent dehydrogenase (short-subunit alcohol dehydrogenase family)